MAIPKIILREFEVAFSKHSQPHWFRLVKYIVLSVLMFLFWKNKSFWIILTLLCIVALGIHFWVRYKTKGWTQSYGLWDYEKNKSKYS